MAYLDQNPPVRSQFRDPRREQPSGLIVVHTAENVMDTVGVDTGAEAVANFIRTRTTPGSYHDLIDSDSVIHMVRYTCEAFHDATGSNPHSFGLSFACRTSSWSTMGPAKRQGFIDRGARCAAVYARWVKAEHGITIPSARISRPQSEAKQPGFISHAQRDPARRTDPGQEFPWPEFLARFRMLMAVPDQPAPPPPEDDDDMFTYEYQTSTGTALVLVAGGKQVRLTGQTLLDRRRDAEAHLGAVGDDERARFTKVYGAPVL